MDFNFDSLNGKYEDLKTCGELDICPHYIGIDIINACAKIASAEYPDEKDGEKAVIMMFDMLMSVAAHCTLMAGNMIKEIFKPDGGEQEKAE